MQPLPACPERSRSANWQTRPDQVAHRYQRHHSEQTLHWVKAPTHDELTQLTYRIAERIGRYLERQGLLERDVENSHLAVAVDDDPMHQLLGHSITYRIAVGPHQGRKVFTLQTLPPGDDDELFTNTAGNVAGFSLHAGVVAKQTNATNSNACAATSRAPLSRKSVYR